MTQSYFLFFRLINKVEAAIEKTDQQASSGNGGTSTGLGSGAASSSQGAGASPNMSVRSVEEKKQRVHAN